MAEKIKHLEGLDFLFDTVQKNSYLPFRVDRSIQKILCFNISLLRNLLQITVE